ncbi:MAG: Trm112 family protein [Verrucomicrobiales bacterium]|nr:Trm112 family protein [Verrucomicrobiales bacterium]
MIAPDLLELLCCPETHQPVRLAEPELIERLNAQIAAGTLTNRAGQRVAEKLDGGLVRADGRVLYPIRDGIPVMLVEEAIALGA